MNLRRSLRSDADAEDAEHDQQRERGATEGITGRYVCSSGARHLVGLDEMQVFTSYGIVPFRQR